ncbi:MAG: methionyl-tRNA formyltransferase [bacterium]|nr:methionyl-tRNA formyltransferase [bacterium]
MNVAFFGTPEFAVPTLTALLESRHPVRLVISRPDKPVGRRQVMTPPPVVEVARTHDLEILQPAKLKNSSVEEALRTAEIDIAVVVAYGRLIPSDLLKSLDGGFLNLHPSLLPRHRGPSPIQWSLVCGDHRTGVTTMLLDEGMDTGPILLQESVPIEPKDTSATLSPRLAKIGAKLIVATLDGLEDGAVEPRSQPSDGVNVTPMLRRDFARIDWSMASKQLVDRLRGFTPWPGLFTSFREGRLKIFGLEEVNPAPSGTEKPGTVIEVDAAGIVVRCGRKTAARITEVQREGRKRMPVDAFLIGERVAQGEQLG